jgi:hypothetical protein
MLTIHINETLVFMDDRLEDDHARLYEQALNAGKVDIRLTFQKYNELSGETKIYPMMNINTFEIRGLTYSAHKCSP